MLLVRLARWQGVHAAREPLVWVLHVAYAWIPVGILLSSAAAVGLAPQTAGVHALTSGAITTMIIAVASRAALGHTSRALQSHPLLTMAYVSITLAAIARVAATAGPGARVLLMISATAWTLGFLTPGAPAGLGVREAVLVALLTPSAGEPAALTAALAFRAATLGGDLLFYLSARLPAFSTGE